MREFERCLEAQLRLHPSMQPQDVFKLCYQAARGGEHLLSDLAAAREYLRREFDEVRADAGLPLYEPISSRYCRVNLGAWKAAGRKVDDLFTLFAAGGGKAQSLEPYLATARAVWRRSGREETAFAAFEAEYRGAGCPLLHHSEQYRLAERPAYRVCRIIK